MRGYEIGVETGGKTHQAPIEPARGGVMRHLFWDNPMVSDATRQQRRLVRLVESLGRYAPSVIVVLFAAAYMFALAECAASLPANAQVVSGEPMLLQIANNIELLLITVVVPLSIFGAISGERERATWDALVLTSLTPTQIIAGKLIWRLRLIVAIVLLSVPFLAVSVMEAVPLSVLAYLGSDDGRALVSHMFAEQVVFASWGILLCFFCLWISARTRRAVISLAVIVASLAVYLLAIPDACMMFFPSAPNPGTMLVAQIYDIFTYGNPFTWLAIHARDGSNYSIGAAAGLVAGYALLSLFLMVAVYVNIHQVNEDETVNQ